MDKEQKAATQAKPAAVFESKILFYFLFYFSGLKLSACWFVYKWKITKLIKAITADRKAEE